MFSQRLPLTLILTAIFCPFVCLGAHAATGTKLENVELASLKGGKRGYLGKAQANVFIFFQPGQEHSRTTLLEMAKCEKELAAKSIHWAAIVSDKFPKEEVEAEIKNAGLAMPVLIDRGDELYAKLGVIIRPMVGIANSAHVLTAFQPFTKVNYCETVRAYLLHTLKEISDADLQKVLNPPDSTTGGTTQEARRHLKLGEMLLKVNNGDKAMDSAKKALEKDPNLAAAHSLLGAAMVLKGDCPGAQKSFDEALKLDPQDPRGLQGKAKGCGAGAVPAEAPAAPALDAGTEAVKAEAPDAGSADAGAVIPASGKAAPSRAAVKKPAK